MSVRRQIIAALSASSVSGSVTLYDVDHATRLVDAHAAEAIAKDRAEREKATPTGATATPDFFRRGHVYARQHHGRTIEFHVIHVATAPDCDFPTAFGWRKDPEFDVTLPMDSDDLDGWTDVTEGGGR